MPQDARLDPLWAQLSAHFLEQEQAVGTPLFGTSGDLGCSLGTHSGLRRKRNEDRCAIARISLPDSREYTLAILCDGVGGSNRGEEAAAMACAASIWLLAEQRTYIRPVELLGPLVHALDEILREILAGEGLTTLTMVLSTEESDLALTSVGDSRIYSWEVGGDLIQLLDDETLENELRQLKGADPSFLTERGLHGSLSQAIGEINRSSEDLRVRVVGNNQIPPGGFLLASDGVWKQAENAFLKIARNSRSGADLVRKIVTSAAWMGGIDNATAICVPAAADFNAKILGRGMMGRAIRVWTPSGYAAFLVRGDAPPLADASGAGRKDSAKETAAKKPGKRSSAKTKSAKAKGDPQMSLVDPADEPKVARKILVEPDDN